VDPRPSDTWVSGMGSGGRKKGFMRPSVGEGMRELGGMGTLVQRNVSGEMSSKSSSEKLQADVQSELKSESAELSPDM
jgi:hypothetical protein